MKRFKVLGKAAATIEDLAFGVWFLREVDTVDLRVFLSEASYAAAEKAKRRMALKIRREPSSSPKPFLPWKNKRLLSIIKI